MCFMVHPPVPGTFPEQGVMFPEQGVMFPEQGVIRMYVYMRKGIQFP
jgi:hypothetical protein